MKEIYFKNYGIRQSTLENMVKSLNKEFWSNKKVFITGHTGFKGSWLISILLSLGAKVQGLSLKEPVSSPSLFDILDLKNKILDLRGTVNQLKTCVDALNSCNPDILIHLAAQPIVIDS